MGQRTQELWMPIASGVDFWSVDMRREIRETARDVLFHVCRQEGHPVETMQIRSRRYEFIPSTDPVAAPMLGQLATDAADIPYFCRIHYEIDDAEPLVGQ